MWILTFENAKEANFLKNPHPHFQKLMFKGTVNFDFWKSKTCKFLKKSAPPFSKDKVYRHCEFLLSKMAKNANFLRNPPPHFQKLMFTGIVNFDFRKCKKREFFLKIICPFSKVNVYRYCEFWLSKMQKKRIFKKKPPPIFKSYCLQALWILTFENAKNANFLKYPPPPFLKNLIF